MPTKIQTLIVLCSVFTVVIQTINLNIQAINLNNNRTALVKSKINDVGRTDFTKPALLGWTKRHNEAVLLFAFRGEQFVTSFNYDEGPRHQADKILAYKDFPIPEPKKDEVLIRVRACGICGSDIPRVFHSGVHFYPITVGHEFSGEITAVGACVKNIQEGERVTAAPLIPCGHCNACEQGNPAMCTHYSFVGTRQQGAMAEYVAVPAKNVVKIVDSMSYEQAACIEPITVAIHGIERAGRLDSGKSAVVYGCGTIGMLTMECLKAKGLGRVYAVDIEDNKLALAKELGAYEALNSRTVNIPTYFAEHELVDYALETAGVPSPQAQMPELVKKRGTIVYIGTAHGKVTYSEKAFEKILRGELFVTGSWMSFSAPFPGSEWQAAVELLGSGKVKVDKLVTHKFSLRDGIKAFETLTNKEGGAINVMYTMEG